MAFRPLRKFSSLKMADDTTPLKVVEKRQQFGDGSFQATARVFCPWNELEQTKAKILGGQRADGSVELPCYYDITKPTGEFAGNGYPLAVATVCSSELVGGFTDTSEATITLPKHTHIDVQFANPGWTYFTTSGVPTLPTTGSVEPLNSWCITESMEQSSEFLTLPSSKKIKFFWGLGDSPVDSESEIPPMNKTVPMGTWMVTRHYVTESELTSSLLSNDPIEDYIGTVNKVRYKSLKFNMEFEPESLLFETPVKEDFDTPMGRVTTVTFVMRWRPGIAGVGKVPNGWNAFNRPGYDDLVPLSIKHPDTDDSSGAIEYFRPYKIADWGNWLPKPGRPS
jgi:hypothetical protein